MARTTNTNTSEHTRSRYDYAGAYIYETQGSAARQVAPVIMPEPEEPQRQPQPQKQPKKKPSTQEVRKYRQRAFTMSGIELCIIAIFLIAAVGCVGLYLQLQTQNDRKLADIQALESALRDLRAENDKAEQEINRNIDYEMIYNTAVEELGMHYPGKDQVLYYDSVVSEYFQFNEQIPQ